MLLSGSCFYFLLEFKGSTCISVINLYLEAFLFNNRTLLLFLLFRASSSLLLNKLFSGLYFPQNSYLTGESANLVGESRSVLILLSSHSPSDSELLLSYPMPPLIPSKAFYIAFLVMSILYRCWGLGLFQSLLSISPGASSSSKLGILVRV